MAIRVEFKHYELIVPEQTGQLYFPECIGCDWNWGDGIVCAPWGSLERKEMIELLDECKDKGLSGLKEIDGMKEFADFCVANKSIDYLKYKCDWLRVYKGVAWNPEYPFGKNEPNEFPCHYGGFYYESKEVWEQSKMVLLAFDEAIQEFQTLVYEYSKANSGDLSEVGLAPAKILYDDFFIELGDQTDMENMRENAPDLFYFIHNNKWPI